MSDSRFVLVFTKGVFTKGVFAKGDVTMRLPKKNIPVLGLLLLLWVLAGCGAQITDKPRFAFVLDSATAGTSVGSISAFSVVRSTGVLSPIGSSVKTGNNPTAITSDLHGRLLYAANLDDGTISAFGINRADGSIFTTPSSPFATGDSPLNLVIDRATKFLFVANNGSSSISVFHINRTDASLKLLPGSPVDTPDPPINLAVAPSGKFLYAATGTNGIEVLSVSSTGVLALVDQQASVTGNLSNLAISPNGKFLFAVDDDATVSAYTIDAVTGKLALIAGSPFAAGDQPSTIAVDPSGRFVYAANQGSNDISAFSINADGSLTAITGSPFVTGVQPLQITVDPSGRFVYTANIGDRNVSVFSISSTTPGALNAVGTAAVASPVFMTITR